MQKIDPAWLRWPATQRLVAAFAGHEIRFVGGAVRDAVLGRAVSDVDAATPMFPQDVIALLTGAGIKAIPTGIEHGTVTAVVESRPFEVTTLRRDVSTDGRHAEVAFTDDWREDASRRDFTMNALYCDAGGNITDFFGGVEDAKAGRVRFIGGPTQRIREDALRILRFFRFYAHYGQAPLDAAGLAACGENSALIDTLSGERIRQEMLKLLLSGRAAPVLEVMQQVGILQRVLGCHANVEALMLLPVLLEQSHEPADAILALALLLRNADGDVAEHVECIHARWKFSNAQHKQLRLLANTRLQLMQHDALIKRQVRVLGRENFIQLMLLYAAEGADHDAVLAAIAFARTWEVPVFPVTGDDLKALGFAQGRTIGEQLRTLENRWEKSGYTESKDTLLGTLRRV